MGKRKHEGLKKSINFLNTERREQHLKIKSLQNAYDILRQSINELVKVNKLRWPDLADVIAGIEPQPTPFATFSETAEVPVDKSDPRIGTVFGSRPGETDIYQSGTVAGETGAYQGGYADGWNARENTQGGDWSDGIKVNKSAAGSSQELDAIWKRISILDDFLMQVMSVNSLKRPNDNTKVPVPQKEATVVRELIQKAGGTIGSVTRLPDGSGCFTASFPLPKNHWLYEKNEDDFQPEMPEHLKWPAQWRTAFERNLKEALKVAIRGATNGGKDEDFDPDALILNFFNVLFRPSEETTCRPTNSDTEPSPG